jgi:hypothetical protein
VASGHAGPLPGLRRGRKSLLCEVRKPGAAPKTLTWADDGWRIFLSVEKEERMIFGIPLSALGISIALVGICITLVFTKPYIGVSYYSDGNKKKDSRKVHWANIGNCLLILGTGVQLISLFIK